METEPAGLTRIRRVARLLDESIGIPGTRFQIGIDPLLGLLPVAGDIVAAVLSLYLVVEAARLGVRKRTLVRMVLNIALDAVAGMVPLVGDLFDAVWKANTRNADLVAADLGVED